MTGTEIYKRTPAYEREAREIRLHAPHWKLLLAYDGQRSLSEVALSAEIAFADALPLTQKFLDQSWIEEMPITLEQYLKRVGARDVPSGGAVPPPTVLHEPARESTPPGSSPAIAAAPVEHAPPPLPVTPPIASPASAAKPPEFVLGPSKVPPLKTPGRTMRLSAVVDFITSLVGNIAVGQLLVYRVFLRVPPELLLAEDIASVYLVHDTSIVLGEKLQKAINDAVMAVTKKSLPDSVFAAA